MTQISNAEREVNQIRLKLYEETKDLTSAQYKERLDRITEAAAKKYGFRVVVSARGNT
jgi:vacuolar-type H+-ATPase subunit E/Vma4